MKLMNVRLHNYGPFKGEHTFQLADRGLLLIRGDNRDEPRMNSNGSGKSSMVEAVDWCLFGAVPRADSVDSVVHQGLDACGVEVTLVDDDDAEVVVTRKREGTKSSLVLTYNGDDASSLDAKETQKHIEWHLGVDRQVFHSTVLFAQPDLFNFADAQDSERMAILTKILRLEEIDAWAATAKTMAKAAEGARFSTAQQVSGLDGQASALEDMDTAAQAATWETERTQRCQQLQQQMEECRAGLAEVQRKLASTADVQASLQAAQQPIAADPAIAAANAELDRRRKMLNGASSLTQVKDTEIRRVTALQQKGDFCPECEQAITHDSKDRYARRLSVAQSERAKAEELTKGFEGAVVASECELGELRAAHEAKVREHQQRLTGLQAQLQSVQWDQQHQVRLQQQYKQLEQELQGQNTAANPYHEQQKLTQSKLKALRKQRAELVAQLAEHDLRISQYNFWAEGCSARGLKSYILDSRLQEMTDASNAWVKLLTGGTIWIRLESTTPTKAGTQRNKFNIRVFRQEASGAVTERNYRSWSGGEKQRVSLGIDFGLSRLIAQRARKPYDILILDEIFKALDAAGREAVMEMLQQLRREKKTILVVDHDAEFQGMFEQCITVQKERGCAQIVEAEDGPTDAAPAVSSDSAGPTAGRKPRAAKASSAPRNRRGSRKPVGGVSAGGDDGQGNAPSA